MAKIKICFLSHVFIKNKDDATVPFLWDYCQILNSDRFSVDVVAPMDKNLSKHQVIDSVRIWRFKYAPNFLQKLAYRGNMDELVRKSFTNKIVFLSFIFCFFYKSLRVAYKRKVDVIHSHWWFPAGLVGLLISVILRKPLIITCHGTDVYLLGKSKLLKFFAKLVFTRANKIVVVSNYLGQVIMEKSPENSAKIITIPMPLNDVFLKDNKTKNNAIVHAILGVGSLIPKKDFKTFIKAIKILLDQSFDVKAVIVGSGPQKNYLEELVAGLKIGGRIKFVGSVPHSQIYQYYDKSDIFVLPSREEGLGMVIAEAMASKCAVVAAASGGIPELVINEKTGLLFKAGSSSDLAKQLSRLIKNSELSDHLINNARRLVDDNYSKKSLISKIEKLYFNL
ncbi:glycosyltransferase family 4 protein [Patescibacteria group bacterium]|nr:glycosyltransferase family 4 protein [Patescibacteria group bacterium]